MRRYAWVSGRPQSLARRIGPIPGETVASPAYLESHGIPKTFEELIDHACLMHGTNLGDSYPVPAPPDDVGAV